MWPNAQETADLVTFSEERSGGRRRGGWSPRPHKAWHLSGLVVYRILIRHRWNAVLIVFKNFANHVLQFSIRIEKRSSFLTLKWLPLLKTICKRFAYGHWPDLCSYGLFLVVFTYTVTWFDVARNLYQILSISKTIKNWQILNNEQIPDLGLTKIMWLWTNFELQMP